MRRLLLILGIVVYWAGLGTRAEAQNYPWCAQHMGIEGGGTNCGFVSFEQCMETARGAGAFCVRNTQYYAPRPGAASAGQAAQALTSRASINPAGSEVRRRHSCRGRA
jgi:Protein of unknown function (DUF3551)